MYTAKRMYDFPSHVYFNHWNVFKDGVFVDQLKAMDASHAIGQVKDKEDERERWEAKNRK